MQAKLSNVKGCSGNTALPKTKDWLNVHEARLDALENVDFEERVGNLEFSQLKFVDQFKNCEDAIEVLKEELHHLKEGHSLHSAMLKDGNACKPTKLVCSYDGDWGQQDS